MRSLIHPVFISALLLATLSCQKAVPSSEAALAPQRPAPAAPEGQALVAEPVSEASMESVVLAHLKRYEKRSRLTEAELERLARTVVEESARHDLDPALVLAVMHVESRYDAYAVSPADALGLMQLLPSTGEWLAPSVGVDWHGPQTLFDPVANVRLGVAYLRQLVDRYDGSIRTALLAYNWGPGRIDRRLRHGTPLPREYAQLVFAAYDPS